MAKWKKDEFKALVSSNREELEQQKKQEMEEYLHQKQLRKREEDKFIEEARKEEYRQLSLFYREKNLEKKIKKQKIHKEICTDIMNFILDLSDVLEQSF